MDMFTSYGHLIKLKIFFYDIRPGHVSLMSQTLDLKKPVALKNDYDCYFFLKLILKGGGGPDPQDPLPLWIRQ